MVFTVGDEVYIRKEGIPALWRKRYGEIGTVLDRRPAKGLPIWCYTVAIYKPRNGCLFWTVTVAGSDLMPTR